jgi:hypothetical protein
MIIYHPQRMELVKKYSKMRLGVDRTRLLAKKGALGLMQNPSDSDAPPHSHSILPDISETWTSSSTSTSTSTISSSARRRLRPSPLSPPRTTTKPTTRRWWAPGTSLRDGGQRLPGRPERGLKIRLLAKARGVDAVQVELFPKLGDLHRQLRTSEGDRLQLGDVGQVR